MNFEAHETVDQPDATSESKKNCGIPIRVASQEAQTIEKELASFISGHPNLEPQEKKILWDEIGQTLAEEKERYTAQLEQVDTKHREICHAQVQAIQGEYEHLIRSFTENLRGEFDEAIGMSFHISDVEFEEILAQVDLMVPIDIRGLTEEERSQLGKQKTDTERLIAEIPWFIEETASESVQAILLPPGSEGALKIVQSLTVDYVDREVARKEFVAQGLDGEELERAVNTVARPFDEVLQENWLDAVFCIVSLLPVTRFVGKAGQGLVMKTDGQILDNLRQLGGPAWNMIEQQMGIQIALNAAKTVITKGVNRAVSKAGNTVIGAAVRNEALDELK